MIQNLLRKKRNIVLGIVILVSVVILVAYFVPSEHGEYIKYSDFYSLVEQGEVLQAEISNSMVDFKQKADEKSYYTDNPQYDQFLEFLLLHDVRVIQETGTDQVLYHVMDIAFNVVFFTVIGGILFIVYRFFYKQFPLVKRCNTRFANIAGMEDVKKDLMQLVDLMKHPKEYEQQGIRQPHGILLAGPPGNGKTLMARALAGEAGINFIAAKATDFQSMYMSIGPAKVKSLFRKARKHAPCIVFIDEFDGIGEKRNYAGHGIDKENNRVITSLLNELDGFTRNESGVLVIGATNTIRDLDPALIRPGRFDRRYILKNPDLSTRVQLIQLYLAGKSLESEITVENLAHTFEGFSCAQIEAVINEAALIANQKKEAKISKETMEKAIGRL